VSELPKRAMIMAAGLGTRMRPLTDDRPKPLVVVQGKSLIDHSVDRLVHAGVTMVVVNIHYKAQMLKQHLLRRKDIEIRFSEETEELLGTGGGVAKALQHFEGEPFFILNSDSIWVEGYGSALRAMMHRWDPERMDGLMLLASMVTALGYDGRGDFVMEPDGTLARVPERKLSPFAYPGVQIAHPRLFADAPQGAFSTNLMWDRAIAKGRLFGMRLDGVWIHVGTPQAVREADAYLADLTPAA
jgi:MurNAc alpha-1-phosphate uridylyltransferase